MERNQNSKNEKCLNSIIVVPEWRIKPLPEERRASDIKLESIEKKLDEHSSALNRLLETVQQIAIQQVHIQSLQSMQNEMRGDINEIYGKISEIRTFQSQCPKGSLTNIWRAIVSMALLMAGAFLAHVFGAK